MSSLKEKTLISSKWVIFATVSIKIFRLASNIILAHFLSPAVFGLVALGDVFFRGIKTLSAFGFEQAVVQSKRNDTNFLNTAWTLQIIKYLGIGLVGLIFAYPFSVFYGYAELLTIIVFISATIPLTGFTSISFLTIKRDVNMRPIMIIETIEALITRMVMIGVALITPTFWALLLGNFFGLLYKVIASYLQLPAFKHRLVLDKSSLKDMFHFGIWISIGSVILFLGSSLDKLMIGKLSGLENAISLLGVYTISYTFAYIPLEFMANISGHVLFPVMSYLNRERPDEMGTHFLKMRHYLLLIALLLTMSLVLFSPYYFSFFYSGDYQSAQWMVPLICISIWISLLNSSANQTLLSLGKTKFLAFSGAVKVGLMFPSFYLGYTYFQFPGFIVAGAIPLLAEHIFDLVILNKRGIRLWTQDIWFSAALIFMVYTLNFLGTLIISPLYLGLLKFSILVSLLAFVVVQVVPILKSKG